jgi:hypothetical protein
MTELFVPLVCFLVPIACLFTGALLALTMTDGGVQARIQAGVKKQLEAALRNAAATSEDSGTTEKLRVSTAEPKSKLIEMAS